MILNTNPRSGAYTLRALARLLSYPDAQLRQHLGVLRDALHEERALSARRLDELDALIDSLLLTNALESEAAYVELFDRGRRTALHLFEHVHGDSRDRGPAMVDLVCTYEAAGLLLAPGELPDYLPVALEYASTQPPRQAREFLGEIAPILQVIFSALLERRSHYASVLAAVLDLAGAQAQAVTLPEEPELDASWDEPAAFGGCSTQGQARPLQPQPIRILRQAAIATAPDQPPTGARS
jgi:nitrate reductase delta subunit